LLVGALLLQPALMQRGGGGGGGALIHAIPFILGLISYQ
jgi:hypothetical protein